MAKPKRKLSQKQLEEQIEARKAKRSEAARKAAQARWSGERPPSKAAIAKQAARLATSDLTVEHYSDRANPQVSWAAAILKRAGSSEAQRREAARVFSAAAGKRESPWSKLAPEERSEIARRGGAGKSGAKNKTVCRAKARLKTQSETGFANRNSRATKRAGKERKTKSTPEYGRTFLLRRLISEVYGASTKCLRRCRAVFSRRDSG